jgi:hypothetical protein
MLGSILTLTPKQSYSKLLKIYIDGDKTLMATYLSKLKDSNKVSMT